MTSPIGHASLSNIAEGTAARPPASAEVARQPGAGAGLQGLIVRVSERSRMSADALCAKGCAAGALATTANGGGAVRPACGTRHRIGSAASWTRPGLSDERL